MPHAEHVETLISKAQSAVETLQMCCMDDVSESLGVVLSGYETEGRFDE